MASHRRRHRRFPPLSAASAFSASLFLALLLYASLSLLTPPLDRHSLPGRSHTLPDRSSSRLLNRSTIPPELGSITVPSGGGSSSRQDLWASKLAKNYYGCSNASSKFEAAEVVTRPNRYLMIATSGGLNQQRTGITDAVVAARILNATLVVPKLDQKSFWKDVSNFAEIFDVDRFISSLSKDVKIIKELPKKGGKPVRSPYTMRVPRKCTPRCYQNRVLPVLLKKHVVQLTKFDYRLANKLETELQKLRCRVNYHALRFTDQIQKMGETLIHRMKGKNKHFIALHLRFESDMLAFSGCYYGGGEKERRELGAIRRRWKTLHIRNPEKERRQGKCPLTPEEVGLMLRALGFGNDVHIYVASGEVYGGEATLAPLRALFPNFHTKETLATKEELAPHSSFSSRMAALDFMVCDGSDVFVTNNNGNMAKILAGRRLAFVFFAFFDFQVCFGVSSLIRFSSLPHRRYFGHKRTIRPNAKKLYHLFPNRVNMSWGEFASKVRTYQRGFMGEPKEVRAGRGEFHENPTSCICENVEKKAVGGSGSQSRINMGVNNDDRGDDWLNLDYRDNAPRGLDNSTELDDDDDDDDVSTKSDDPELEEIISD